MDKERRAKLNIKNVQKIKIPGPWTQKKRPSTYYKLSFNRNFGVFVCVCVFFKQQHSIGLLVWNIETEKQQQQ